MEMSGIDMTGTRMASTGTGMVMKSSLQPWSGAEFVFMFLMWAVMMVAMMLPSATPMVLRYARIGRATAFDTNPIGPTGCFAVGYLLVWDLRLPPPAHNGRSNAPGCLHRWQARAMLLPVSF